MINTIWLLTTSNKLDLWDEKISDLDPINILDDQPLNRAGDYPSLTEAEFYELRAFFQQLDTNIVDLIGYAIQIGTMNL